MKISFTKMHGAGNDFIMVDDRTQTFPLDDKAFIARIASRRIGVGCDGILLLQPSQSADVRMRFINPDGNEVDMCGNGARCLARFARQLGVVSDMMTIQTNAGLVRAEVLEEQVRLELTDPANLQLDIKLGLPWPSDFVNTGVPHVVVWVEDVQAVDLQEFGNEIRYHERFAPIGTNANFATVEADGTLTVRTYERGVEGETLACGTGAAAVAAIAARRDWVSLPVAVHCTSGYDLIIDESGGRTTLKGNAETVYEGEISYGDRV